MKNTMYTTLVLVLGLLVGGATQARAQESAGDNALERRADVGISIGGKLGGGLGTSALGGTFVTELELGFMLPLPEPIHHSLSLFVSGQYLAPGTDGTSKKDPRLPGDGLLRYEVTQQQLALTFGALYRLPLSTDLLMPYAAIGGRLYMRLGRR
jgi:hypothetical protein